MDESDKKRWQALFRRAINKCHPDKWPSDKKAAMEEKSKALNAARDNGDWATVREIALELGIKDVPPLSSGSSPQRRSTAAPPRKREQPTAGEFLNAVRYGSIGRIRQLLESGAGVNARNSDGETAMSLALVRNQVEIVRLLLEAGADVNLGDVLYQAIKKGQTEIARLLIDGGADASNEALCAAVETKEVDIVRLLLAKGANPNAYTRKISYRSSFGHEETSKYTALYLAVEASQVEIVRLLLEAGAHANQNYARSHGGTMISLIYLAIERGSVEVVHLFIKHGTDVNARYGYDETVLYFAVRQGKIEIVRLLLEKGADVNAQNYVRNIPPESKRYDRDTVRKNITALHLAVIKGDAGIAELLLDSGADPDMAIDGRSYTRLNAWDLIGNNKKMGMVFERFADKRDSGR